jgi:hypothetical protein
VATAARQRISSHDLAAIVLGVDCSIAHASRHRSIVDLCVQFNQKRSFYAAGAYSETRSGQRD